MTTHTAISPRHVSLKCEVSLITGIHLTLIELIPGHWKKNGKAYFICIGGKRRKCRLIVKNESKHPKNSRFNVKILEWKRLSLSGSTANEDQDNEAVKEMTVPWRWYIPCLGGNWSFPAWVARASANWSAMSFTRLVCEIVICWVGDKECGDSD